MTRRRNINHLTEDRLAMIFLGFAVVFLVCHLPRLVLNFYEAANIHHWNDCEAAGEKHVPLWFSYTIVLSHLLLAVNSATNIIVYTSLSLQFRVECRKVFSKC